MYVYHRPATQAHALSNANIVGQRDVGPELRVEGHHLHPFVEDDAGLVGGSDPGPNFFVEMDAHARGEGENIARDHAVKESESVFVTLQLSVFLVIFFVQRQPLADAVRECILPHLYAGLVRPHALYLQRDWPIPNPHIELAGCKELPDCRCALTHAHNRGLPVDALILDQRVAVTQSGTFQMVVEKHVGAVHRMDDRPTETVDFVGINFVVELDNKRFYGILHGLNICNSTRKSTFYFNMYEEI